MGDFVDLSTRLDVLRDASHTDAANNLGTLQHELSTLRKNLTDAVGQGYLPAYDQRQLELVRDLRKGTGFFVLISVCHYSK
jgi:hypothetical protein